MSTVLLWLQGVTLLAIVVIAAWGVGTVPSEARFPVRLGPSGVRAQLGKLTTLGGAVFFGGLIFVGSLAGEIEPDSSEAILAALGLVVMLTIALSLARAVSRARS